MRSLDEIAEDPQHGDKIVGKRGEYHRTRTVYDRTLGGDVCYLYHVRNQWRGDCTLEEWREFCKTAKVTY